MTEFEPELWNQSAPKDGGFGARLIAWLREHGRLFKETLEHIARNVLASLLAWALIGIALSLPLGLYLIESSLSLITEPWSRSPGITVYLQQGTSMERVQWLESNLVEDPRIEAAAYVSPEMALNQFSSLIGLESLVEDLDENPLPGSFDVVPVPGMSTGDHERLLEELQSIQEVRDVVSEGLWLDRVLAVSELIRRLSWILAGLFGVGAVLVTASSVRLVIESRLAELQVMSLVGATTRFMRRPFVYFGIFYGIGGALMATMLISASVIILREPARQFLGSYGVRLSVPGFDPPLVAFLFVVAALLGAAGALAACSRRLKSLDS